MKASELIKALGDLLEEHRDANVYFDDGVAIKGVKPFFRPPWCPFGVKFMLVANEEDLIYSEIYDEDDECDDLESI